MSTDFSKRSRDCKEYFGVRIWQTHKLFFWWEWGGLGDMKGHMETQPWTSWPSYGRILLNLDPWHSKGQQGQWKFTKFIRAWRVTGNKTENPTSNPIHGSCNASPFLFQWWSTWSSLSLRKGKNWSQLYSLLNLEWFLYSKHMGQSHCNICLF